MLRRSTALNATPNDRAADWIDVNWPIPAGVLASRNTATRVTPGAIALSNSSHLAQISYSAVVKPVALPPGRARLSTKPAATGSGVCVNTMGMVRVACNNGRTTDVGSELDQFSRKFLGGVALPGATAIMNFQIAAFGPP